MMTRPQMTIEQLLADLAHYATAENTVMYEIGFRNAGVSVKWHEEKRVRTAEYAGKDMQTATANATLRMNEGLVVYGYHDDLRTALACELVRFIVLVTDGDNEEMRRNTIRDHCMAGESGWFGKDPLTCLFERQCIACEDILPDPDQHSEARELNYAMTTLCTRCQGRIGL